MLSSAVDRRRLLLGHTSGTTGSPLEFWWDRRVCVWNHLMTDHYRSWAGFRDGDPIATLLGNVIVPLGQRRPPFWRYCLPWNKTFFSSFHLERRHLASYAAKLREMGPVWLEAYPSTAYVLAEYLEERGERLPLRGVFLSSETLTPAVREAVDRSFATRAFDTYSMSERVIGSGECERHDGQHLFFEPGIVEVVDDRGEPVPPGRPGRLVATGLQNLAMPLLRYDTGDVGGVDPRPCPCGRTLPLLLPITTKAEDIVRTPDGRFVSSSVLTHPFKPMVHIEKSQIVQESVDRITVRIVRRPEYGEEDSRRLVDGLRGRLGPEIDIRLEFVADIPRSASGKYRWVVSRVPLEIGSAGATNLFWREDRPADRPGA
jgi:phenylacetate-CoA ligase